MNIFDAILDWLRNAANPQSVNAAAVSQAADVSGDSFFASQVTPGPLRFEAPARMPTITNYIAFGVYGPDVSNTPDYSRVGIAGHGNTSRADKLQSVLRGLFGNPVANPPASTGNAVLDAINSYIPAAPAPPPIQPPQMTQASNAPAPAPSINTPTAQTPTIVPQSPNTTAPVVSRTTFGFGRISSRVGGGGAIP